MRLLGGVINKSNRFTYSQASIEAIKHIHFNTAFIGAGRIRPDGVYVAQNTDAELTQTAVARSSQVVLIAKKYKFTNQKALPFKSTDLAKIDVLITDMPVADKFKHLFSERTQIISVL